MNRATVRYTNKRRHLHHRVLVLLPVVLLLCVISVLVVKTRGDRTSSHPLFYTDLTTGKEARINTAIVTAASLDYPYENTTNTFQSRFKRTLTDDAMVTVTQGEHVVSFGIPVTQSFGTLTQTDAVVTANTIVYPEVAPGANLRYTVTPEQLLEEYVMTSRDAATHVDALSQRIDLGTNRAVVNLDGSVTISDQHQVPVFTLPKPVLYEDRFHKTRSYGIAYTLTQDNGSTILTKTLTPEGTAWLTDPHRRYPVVLDAAVTVATTTSGSGTAFSFQNKLFYDTVHNRYWAFYYDGSTIAYSYSTDGITWSSGGTLAYNTYDFSISYKEIAGAGTVYVATTCGSTGSVCVMKGIVGKTSISFSQGGEYTALTGTDATADAYTRVSIALDANNIIWVAARRQTKPTTQLVFTYQAYAVSSTQANTHSNWNSATPVGPIGSLLTTLILLPKTGSTMALVAKDVGGTNIVSYQYNGTSWSSMNAGGDYSWLFYEEGGLNSNVYALTVAGDGTLYAGGGFTVAGGITVNRIAKWNGTSWSALGAGVNGNVNALALAGDGTLYAGGAFTVADGITVNYISKWNGTSWSALGAGMISSVNALALAGDGTLYAGGGFTSAGGITVNRIAKWNGISWSGLGGGTNGIVRSIAISPDGSLYAGGDFTTAEGTTVNRIAKWNGTSWSALGAGMNSTVYALTVAGDGTLYAGGGFTVADGITVNRIAKWNGTSWSALGAGMNSTVYALTVAGDGTLYAGGAFTVAGGITVNRIAKWNGTSWSALGAGMSSSVNALALAGDGTLYANKYQWAPAISAGTSQIQEVSAVSDASGNIHVLYVDDNSDVQYKTYNGTSWGSKTALYASGPVATNPAITIDSDGYVYAFWRIGPSIYYAKSNTPGGSFSSPTTLYNTGTNTYVTASSGNNRILVSWINGVANPYTVLFDQTRTLTPTPHPTPPLSGNYTLSIDSGWSNLYDDGTLPTPSRKAGGVDAGTGITNSASLTVEHGVLNILDNETLVVGSLIMGVGGEVAIAEGATLKIGNALFVKDADSDGFAAESKVYYVATGTPTPAGGKRLNTISTLASVDCNDASYNVSNSCCEAVTLYADQDGDGYGAGSPQTKCPEAGWVENNTDCKDTGTGAALVWVTASCYQDADNDDYGNTTAITCTDNATCTSATAGAVNAAGDAATGTFAANNTDCADAGVDSNHVWATASCYKDADNDDYGSATAITCTNNANCALATMGYTASPPPAGGAQEMTLAVNNTDCKDTGVNANLVWVTASCYQDADNDDYGNTTAITCTDNATCTSATAGAVNAAGDAATGTFAAVNTDCCDSSNIAYPGATTACTSTALTGCTPAGGQYDYNCDGTSSKTGCTACYAQSGGQLYCRSNCSAYYYTGSQAACGASGKLRGTLSSCYPYDARGDCTADTGFGVVNVYKVGASCSQGCR